MSETRNPPTRKSHRPLPRRHIARPGVAGTKVAWRATPNRRNNPSPLEFRVYTEKRKLSGPDCGIPALCACAKGRAVALRTKETRAQTRESQFPDLTPCSSPEPISATRLLTHCRRYHYLSGLARVFRGPHIPWLLEDTLFADCSGYEICGLGVCPDFAPFDLTPEPDGF